MNGNYKAIHEMFREVNGTEEQSLSTAEKLVGKLADRKHWGRHSAANKMFVALPSKWTPHVPEKGGRIYKVKGENGILIVPVEVLIERLTNAANGAFATNGKFIPCVYSPRQGVRLAFAKPLFNAGIRLQDAEVETLKTAILKARKLPKDKGFSTSEGTVYFLEQFL